MPDRTRHLRLIVGLIVLAVGFASTALAQGTIVFASNRPLLLDFGVTSLHRVNADGTDMRDLTPGWPETAQREWEPAVSPDSQWIAFVAEGRVWRMRIDGTDRTYVTDNAEVHTNAWSADGSQIYFSTPGTCAEDIDVVNVDGTGRRKAVDAGVDFPEGVAALISVSKYDELAVIGGNCGSGPRNLYLMNSDRTNIRLLLHGVNQANWAADGERLVLTRCTEWLGCQIWTMYRDGSGLVQITPNTGQDTLDLDPSWSPDGSRIVFSRPVEPWSPSLPRFPDTHLYTMAADGSDLQQITFGRSVIDRHAVWVADPDVEPPVFDPIQEFVAEASSAAGAVVNFPQPTATDAADGAVTVSCNPLSGTMFSLGVTPVSCSATDGAGNVATAGFLVRVQDTTPPSITSASASATVLWPPNHRLVQVMLSASSLDQVTAQPVCRVATVSSSEPVDGLGDGDTGPDWVIAGGLTVYLRAERGGKGEGRVYTVEVECADDAGNSGTRNIPVAVPKNQSKK